MQDIADQDSAKSKVSQNCWDVLLDLLESLNITSIADLAADLKIMSVFLIDFMYV